MKMRIFNNLLAGVIVIVSVLALIAVLTGQHTLFGTIAASVSTVVAIGMYLRTLIGTAALSVADKQQELMFIAIAQKRNQDVVNEFAKWMETNDTDFMGAKICNLVDAVDESGKRAGFFLLLVGTRDIYNKIRKEGKDKYTVLDYWPVDWKKYAQSILDDYAEYENAEVVEEEGLDVPMELKG